VTGAVVVTGATGLVGRRLVASLRADARPVRIVSRKPNAPGFDAGVEVATWDGVRLDADILRDASALVHLAGEPVFGGLLTAARRHRITESRVAATEALVQSLAVLPEAERPACFVCASAVGYYGSRGDAPLEESSAPGEGFLAEVCVEWERAAREAAALGVRTVSLRIGIVLAKEGGALPMMAAPFRFGFGGRLGDGRQWVPWIHVDDLVSMVRAICGSSDWVGRVNAVSRQAVTNADLTRSLGDVLRRPTLLPVPAFAIRGLLGELAGELLGSRKVVPRVALERGFSFAHPELEGALRDALEG
jgi:uncharacterized protein (TIGR01777 family)